MVTAIKDTSFFTAAFDDFTFLAFRTHNPDILDDRFGISAIRESGASQKFSESAKLINKVTAAFLAYFI